MTILINVVGAIWLTNILVSWVTWVHILSIRKAIGSNEMKIWDPMNLLDMFRFFLTLLNFLQCSISIVLPPEFKFVIFYLKITVMSSHYIIVGEYV